MSESETKENLIAAGKNLFLSRGYGGTSVDMICRKAKVSKGSFYHFFESKEDLGLNVLQWSLEKADLLLSEGDYTRIQDPLERSFAYLQHVENSALMLWGNGCILASLAYELAEVNPRLQAAIADIFAAVTRSIASRVEPIATRLEPSPGAFELAEQFLIVQEGAVTLARAYREPDRITKALRNFRKSLEAQVQATA